MMVLVFSGTPPPQPQPNATATTTAEAASERLSSPEMLQTISRRSTGTQDEWLASNSGAGATPPPPPPRFASSGASGSNERHWSTAELTVQLGGASSSPEEAGGLEAVTSPGSAGSTGKPPIFPVGDRSSSGLRASLRKVGDGVSPAFLRRGDRRSGDVDDDGVPQFMKEFAGVVRRRGGGGVAFNPNEPAPPRTPEPTRPHSIALSPPPLSAAAISDVDKNFRRKSDFMARYEHLIGRATAALNLVSDEGGAEGAAAAPSAPETPLSPEPEDVDFDEEAVLQTCQNFLKDYDASKKRKSLTEASGRTPWGERPQAEEAALSLEPSPTFRSTRRVSAVSPGSALSVQVRNRSSSLSLLDRRMQIGTSESQPLKPILKKSSEDLHKSLESSPLRPVPILKNKDLEIAPPIVVGASAISSGGGILKRRSEGDASARPDHIRIRSPSPDQNVSNRRPILRSRNNSTCDERCSSPEPQSILKRRASLDDFEADSRSSPEPPPTGILKRKYSSANTSGSHTPESIECGGGGRPLSSILKRPSTASGGSLDEAAGTAGHIKSLLKKSQRTDDDDLLVLGEATLPADPGAKPRSILKSRRSEESLSPLSDPAEVATTASRRAAAPPTDSDSGPQPRPILKMRDSREELSSGGRSRTLSPSGEYEAPYHYDASVAFARTTTSSPSSRDRDTPPVNVTGLLFTERGDSSRRESGLSFSNESFRTADSEGADSAADLPPRLAAARGVRSEPESGHETAPSTPNSGRASSAAPDDDAPYSPRRPASSSDREGNVSPTSSISFIVPCVTFPPLDFHISLSDRVLVYDAERVVRRSVAIPPPRPPTGSSARSRRGWTSSGARSPSSRFQTQPITVDEVQEASRHFVAKASFGEISRRDCIERGWPLYSRDA